MWFMNKVTNPIVRLILHSPLHRLLSGVLLLITYRGRRSGKRYTLPVQYTREDQVIYIVPGMPGQKTWWRNLRGGEPVGLVLAGRSVAGKAAVLDPAADSAASLHALMIYLQRFPSTARMHGIRRAPDGSFNSEDLTQATLSTMMVRVELDG